MAIKKTTLAFIINIVIKILDYLLKKITVPQSNTAELEQDVQINKNTADIINNFIKKHTIKNEKD